MRVMSGLDARFLFSESPSAHMHTVHMAEAMTTDAGFPDQTMLPLLLILMSAIIPAAGG